MNPYWNLSVLGLSLPLLLTQCRKPDALPCDKPNQLIVSAPRGMGAGKRERHCEDPQGKRNGFAEVRFDNGQVAELSFYQNALRHGDYKSYYANGNNHEAGTYMEGRRDGLFRFWEEDGSLLQEAQYKDGKLLNLTPTLPPCPAGTSLNGNAPPKGQAVWCQKPAPDGTWTNLGPFAAWYDDGMPLARGSYHNGHEEGAVTLWYADGQLKARGNYLHGIQSGRWLSWHPNGERFIESTFENGKEEGPWVSWWEEGGKNAEGVFHKGEESGVWTFWYPSGRLSQQGNYVDGKREGLWKRWTDDKEPPSLVEYRAGEEVSSGQP